MTIPLPRDHSLLSQASSALNEAVERSGLQPTAGTRLRILEGAAARVGGYALDQFDLAVADTDSHEPLPADATTDIASHLAEAVLESPIAPSLALAALGDSDLDPVARRRQGRYFTDSRLALSLTRSVREQTLMARSILDPACGAGILLVAAALQASDRKAHRTHFVEHVLWGVDKYPHAVRAARASISSLTSDLDAIARLSQRLMVADSLTASQEWWTNRSRHGFDLVLGNPPWEKLRITRHEHALGHGHQRHYGDDYDLSESDQEELRSDRRANSWYRDLIAANLALQGQGEPELHKMFVELSAKLTSKTGTLAILIPAGFIRNYGTRDLREWLFCNFDIDIQILDNRERYFGIDTRFKFIQLVAKRYSSSEHRRVSFANANIENEGDDWRVVTTYEELKQIQSALDIPEVRERSDWELYTRLRRAHPDFGSEQGYWHPSFHREVDMTSDRPQFASSPVSSNTLPVIEGRMVHQHRVSAKRYVAGRGRRAEWEAQPPFGTILRPQWYIDRSALRSTTADRIDRLRAGFCDVTGQTNERTVLAALIPQGVVCGNKVPTIEFTYGTQASAWVGVANSFVFDWITRRTVTTTLNFFILRGLPIPVWDPMDDRFRTIAEVSESLGAMESCQGEGDMWDIAYARGRVEVLTSLLYGISVRDLDQIMRDFPQVDKAQPPLLGESASTVTRDMIVAVGVGWATPLQSEHAKKRVKMARSVGAVPFVPNQHARTYQRQT